MSDYDHTIDLLEELDNLSKIHILERDVIDEMMIEFASRIVCTLGIERMSVWIFSKDQSKLQSMGEYDQREKSFNKNSVLRVEHYPIYFEALRKNKIILASNVYENPATLEFAESYSKPHGVITLMDIPLRIAGELVGVMCFEKTGPVEKNFSVREQSFAFSVSLVFASNLEARHRRAAQSALTKSLKEKELLIKEMNHRIKNNFSILISLLNIRKQGVHSDEAKKVLYEFEQRIFSMMTIHDLLHDTDSPIEVNVGEYLDKLVHEFKNAHIAYSGKIEAEIHVHDRMMDSKTLVHLGLIITEIFLNSFKHVYQKDTSYFLKLRCHVTVKGNLCLEIKDSGKAFDFEKSLNSKSLGLSLIKDLAEDLGLTADYPNLQENRYRFVFPLELK